MTLMGDGLTDGDAARGQALAMTWPNGAIVPPSCASTTYSPAPRWLCPHLGRNRIRSDHHYLTAVVAVRK